MTPAKHRRPRRPLPRPALVAGIAAVLTVGAVAIAPLAGASPSKPSVAPVEETPTARQLAIRTLVARLNISTAEATRRLDAQEGNAQMAGTLQRRLGSRAAGSYLDRATGDLVVNVTDGAAADVVTAAGARPRQVTRTDADLRGIARTLSRTSRIPGTAWAVDASSNTVTVQVSATAAADPRAGRWLSSLAAYGDSVRVQRAPTSFATTAFLGGQAILDAGGRSRCSAAFNATSGDRAFVITAGHCTAAVQSWTDGTRPIGDSVVSSFPGDDFGVVAVDDPATLDPQPAILDNGRSQPITGSLPVPVGSMVCKTGSTTGTTCGLVAAYDTTVTYAEGQVSGLIQTDVCTQPGDSGGGLFAADQAQGIVSGGSVGGCNQRGFVSFFQPVDEVLAETGLSLQ